MSLDYVIIDDAKFVDFEQLKDETFQANRGNEMYFKHFPLHHGMTITSDMPVTKKGSWFLSYKDKQDPELVEVIEGIRKLAEENDRSFSQYVNIVLKRYLKSREEREAKDE